MEGFTEYYKSMKGIHNKGKDPLLHPVTVSTSCVPISC
jgi:hypothetical protein